MPVLEYLEKNLILNCNMSLLSVLPWSEKEAHSATGMENNEHLFDKSQILLKVNNGGLHSIFTRSELYLRTKNQSWNHCWKHAEVGSREIVLLLGCFL